MLTAAAAIVNGFQPSRKSPSFIFFAISVADA